MNSITILHLGIKFWPFNDEVINNSSLKGIRGGGMNKYCDMLINSFPSNITSIIICQRLKGQKKKEILGNVIVYRTRTYGSRAIRQIIANGLSFFIALRIIKKEKIKIYHGHMQIGIFIAYVLGKIFKKPVIATPYSFTTIELNFMFNRICKFIESRYYKKVNCLVFESIENRLKAEEYLKFKFDNSLVINTGISIPDKIHSNRNSSLKNILYIGRLVNIKAIDNLILSVLHLNTDISSQIHINIVGEGELFEELNRLIITNNLTEFVTMLGYVENSSEMFLTHDIFILPSHQEGLSISLLEAMSYGLACIVNNFGVPFSENTVFEMENNNPETIAKAITILVRNNDLLNGYKHAARQEVINKFSIKKFANEYSSLYINTLT